MTIQPFSKHFSPSFELRNVVSSYMVRMQDPHTEQVWTWPAFPQQFILFLIKHKIKFSFNDGSFRESPATLVIGPSSKKAVVVVPPGHLAIRVVLQPGALFRICKLPLAEIINDPIDGFDLFSPVRNLLKETCEKLEEVAYFDPQIQPTTLYKMVQEIEHFFKHLVARAQTPLPIDQVFSLISDNPNSYTIDQLVSLSCASVRKFERQFLDRIGVSPKFFIRQSRFAHAFIDKMTNPSKRWASIAQNNGYYDQMHMVKDFKTFAALPPSGFFEDILRNRSETDYKSSLLHKHFSSKAKSQY